MQFSWYDCKPKHLYLRLWWTAVFNVSLGMSSMPFLQTDVVLLLLLSMTLPLLPLLMMFCRLTYCKVMCFLQWVDIVLQKMLMQMASILIHLFVNPSLSRFGSEICLPDTTNSYFVAATQFSSESSIAHSVTFLCSSRSGEATREACQCH
jgi:hypothetical protein